ncbi:related to toxD protein [Phialocephala subalpina]|uniref:Related to toxD protein n=1 Tax=Phialocephala subalpina TaxID=576137 RepID=A0A1L7XL06_9HELO|nr:related to toxD protein [Phialocephala subalpina]
MSSQHLAAILPSQGSRFEIQQRPTPTPGPNELLLEVHSVALNPIDYYSRDFGFGVSSYPAVVGSDIGGIVLQTGSSVKDFKAGDRVASFAPAFFKLGSPDYGALQKKVLVPAVNTTLIPEKLSFDEASLLPMAVLTTWSGFYSIGVARDTAFKPSDKKGFLVWGGASSVGTAAIQVAKSLGYIVFATASSKHHSYIKTLGADYLFDYKDEDVVEKIVKTAKDAGIFIDTGYDAVGAWKHSMQVLHEAKGDAKKAMLASAPPLKEEEMPKLGDVEAKFVLAPEGDEALAEHFGFVFNKWLKEKLAKGEWIVAPKIKKMGGGLEGLNDALDELKKGASGEKLVLNL